VTTVEIASIIFAMSLFALTTGKSELP
jgi:hypothetical protein